MSYKQNAIISNGTFKNKIGTTWKKSNSSRQCFIDIIPPAESASNRNECQGYFLGVKRPVCTADNLTTFVCRWL